MLSFFPFIFQLFFLEKQKLSIMSVVPYSFQYQSNPIVIRPIQTAPVYEGVKIGLYSFIFPPVKRYFIGFKGSSFNIIIDGVTYHIVILPEYCQTYEEITQVINSILGKKPIRGRVSLSFDADESKFKIHLWTQEHEEINPSDIDLDGSDDESFDDFHIDDSLPLKVIVTTELAIALGFERRVHLKFSKSAPFQPNFEARRPSTDILSVKCNLVGREQVNNSFYTRILSFVKSHDREYTLYSPTNILYHFIRTDIDSIEEIRIEVKDQENNIVSFKGLCSGVIFIKY